MRRWIRINRPIRHSPPITPPATMATICLSECDTPSVSQTTTGVSRADGVAEEQAQDADVEQDVAQPQAAVVQQLRAVGLPGVLLALEADQAAQKKDGQGNVGIDAEEELVQGVHDACSWQRSAGGRPAGVEMHRVRAALGGQAAAARCRPGRRRRSPWPRPCRAPAPRSARAASRRTGRAARRRRRHRGCRRAPAANRWRPARGWPRPAAPGPGRRRSRPGTPEQRHMVRQFRHHGFKAMVAVGLQQVHHGLAPVAAFAVHVLEQVQRVRAVAVEGGDVGFPAAGSGPGRPARRSGVPASRRPRGARPARRRSRARRPAAPARGS